MHGRYVGFASVASFLDGTPYWIVVCEVKREGGVNAEMGNGGN